MRNRFWIIILLVVWVGQFAIGIQVVRPGHRAIPGFVWQLVDELGAWVSYQAGRRALGSPAYSGCRHRRAQHRRKRPPMRHPPSAENEAKHPVKPPDKAGPAEGSNVFDPQRWGLSSDKVQELPESLRKCAERYRECFKTKTRNDSQYAYPYLSGLLRMKTQRNYTNIGQATGESGENIQHFMSKSPWPGQAVMKRIQAELKAAQGLEQGGVAILDESANKKAGDKSAGASRQYNGRLGKVLDFGHFC